VRGRRNGGRTTRVLNGLLMLQISSMFAYGLLMLTLHRRYPLHTYHPTHVHMQSARRVVWLQGVLACILHIVYSTSKCSVKCMTRFLLISEEFLRSHLLLLRMVCGTSLVVRGGR
jgi:hypothetical protein